MRLFSFFLVVALTIAARGASSAAYGNDTVPEYLVFEVPELPLTGPAALSWFVLREGRYWDGARFADLREVAWPSWDQKQIPPTLVPGKTPTRLNIYDKDRAVITQLKMDRPFSPDSIPTDAQKPPAFYQVSALLFDGRVELASPLYPWPKRKPILSCESAGKTLAESASSLTACASALRGYFAEATEIKEELYLRFSVPSVGDKDRRRAIAELERELRAFARRRGKVVFLSEKSKSDTLAAELGLTRSEQLPVISLERASWPAAEGAVVRFDKAQPARELYSAFAEDGSGMRIHGYYTDATEDRLLSSPAMGKRRVQVQILPTKAADLRISETRGPEIRTGLRGWLRPWRAELFSSYNQLSSGRGDTSSVLSVPGVSLAWTAPAQDAVGYFQFEKGFLRTGPALEITELKTGAMKRFDSLGGVFLAAGFHQYGLAGTNSGANRLGSLVAGTVGVARSTRFENWYGRAKGDLLLGSSQSFDLRLELGRITREDFAVGGFAGYTYYRGFAANKLGTRELFTESRLQVGVSIGWRGPDTIY